MYRSQQLALKYFAAAMILFGIMIVAGLLASTQYVQDGFLLNKLDFSITKTLHIDTMIIWLLMGFIGAVYWFLPIELEREVEGIKLAEIMFWIFCAAVAVVAAVFIFVQYGPATEMSLWFINQGRKYVEAPRWAAVGITLVVLVFVYNVVATAFKSKKITGIMGVLMLDLIPLFGLYLIAFPSITTSTGPRTCW